MKHKWIHSKNVLISGASSGIGRELTKILIKTYNCNVVGIGRNEKAMLELQEELGDLAKNFSYKLFDVSIKENWKKLSEEFSNSNFQLDVLINNAGMLPKFDKFGKYDLESFEKIINVNYFSSVYSIHYFLNNIKKSSTPAIINVSSSAALCPLAGTSSYSSSKSALKAFTECLIEDYRKDIYIAYVCPGFTKTNIFRDQGVKTEKLIDLVSSSCEKNTKKIVKKIVKKRKRIVVGFDAKLMDTFYRHFPRTFSHTCSKVLKKSKIKLYENVFKKEH